MDVSAILEPLNEAQRQAVAAPIGSQLVLAGAGSGKTRVLVHRIAWLIQTEDMSPFSILAVTFTNKAAAEMRGRIESLLGMPVRGMWVGTFHGIAHRLLRAHWQEAKLPQNFQILDADDQLRLIKRIIKELEIDDKKWPARQSMWFINAQKDEGIRSANIEDMGDLYLKTQVKIYTAYEAACERGGMVDFAELLLRAHELWLKNPSLLAHYQQRFRYLLVDEFQDTNSIQYAWVRVLAGNQNNLMVVGDDDQSIYGWRGAKIENIHQFSKDFPDSEIVRLEQNYRSTGTILKAANCLISQNAGRLGKELWTESGDGDAINLYAGFNEAEEARYVADRIFQWAAEGNLRKESAILYRSNAQSRVLEEALLRAKIPYRIYGGHRFFERAEIRNALAYLRLVNNRHADAAFERVVNVPPRGIGDKSLEEIRSLSRSGDISLWRAATDLANSTELSARARNAIIGFIDLINRMDNETSDMDLTDLAKVVIDLSGLKPWYEKERGEKGQARIENLAELLNATRGFDPDESLMGDPEEEVEYETLLDAFLSHAALEAGDAQGDPEEDCVQLMTLHSAKGLEFPLVFLTGLEEGLFPHNMSLDEPGRLEEERRLCYVGITRAMRHLYLTHAESRRIHGNETYNRPSRFVRELPEELIKEIRTHHSTASVEQPLIRQSAAKKKLFAGESLESGLKIGQGVSHGKFGEGVIVSYEGAGKQMRVQVNFREVGSKWLVLSYAKLQALGS